SYSSTSNCTVYVIVDGVRPYQKTIPTGQAGGNDYSIWKYTFTPAYSGSIREGINKITAKLLCQANPANLTKFYSINVTGINGIVPKQSSAITQNNTVIAPLSSNSSSALFYSTPLINHSSIPTNSNSSAYGKNSKYHGDYCNYSDYKHNIISCA
ncbi:MAG TPA: hypothetical protein VN922_10575, partial [Bacteroidia bacterium]|nr:hypothetical protein [Bacteroidia bacterium]